MWPFRRHGPRVIGGVNLVRMIYDDARDIVAVLGPRVPKCIACAGCNYEWASALRSARNILHLIEHGTHLPGEGAGFGDDGYNIGHAPRDAKEDKDR